MNYDSATDDEINGAVAEIRHEKKIGYFPDGDWCKDPDYCNSPADAWPIIVENGLSLHKFISMGGWQAFDIKSDASYEDLNPLRAAMVVYLKMMEAKV